MYGLKLEGKKLSRESIREGNIKDHQLAGQM